MTVPEDDSVSFGELVLELEERIGNIHYHVHGLTMAAPWIYNGPMGDEVALHKAVRVALDHLGAPARCKGCNREIWWIQHANTHRAPYTEEALNHFIDCPERDKFSQNGKGRS